MVETPQDRKTAVSLKEHLKESFPYKSPLRQDQFLDKIDPGAMFGFVQCYINFSESLREKFANFPPISIITKIGTEHIGPLLQQYAGKERLMSQPRRMLLFFFQLSNGAIVTRLLLFSLELRLVCTKTYHFLGYIPVKCLNNFVQSAVNGRRQVDESPSSSVDAETTKLLANSSYGYKIVDHSRHSVRRYMNDENTHAASSKKIFRSLGRINDQLYEVELA